MSRPPRLVATGRNTQPPRRQPASGGGSHRGGSRRPHHPHHSPPATRRAAPQPRPLVRRSCRAAPRHERCRLRRHGTTAGCRCRGRVVHSRAATACAAVAHFLPLWASLASLAALPVALPAEPASASAPPPVAGAATPRVQWVAARRRALPLRLRAPPPPPCTARAARSRLTRRPRCRLQAPGGRGKTSRPRRTQRPAADAAGLVVA